MPNNILKTIGLIINVLFTTSVIAQIDSSNNTNTIIVSSKTNAERKQVPLAIGKISQKEILQLQPLQWGDVLNRIAGINYINLGNEQHALSIRQPISFKSYFAFLENGLPIRPVGIFNNNALLEIHQTDVQQVELIKGTAGASYGNEAIGGVINYISPNLNQQKFISNASVAITQNGFKRFNIAKNFAIGKHQFLASGHISNRNNFVFEHYNLDKQSVALQHEIALNKTTQLKNRITYVNFFSDMIDSKDSLSFVNKNYKSPHTFTNRKVEALRATSQLAIKTKNIIWQPYVGFRKNSTEQNPSYLIVEDVWFGGSPLKAQGEINVQAFTSYLLGMQNVYEKNNSKIAFGWQNDFSPSSFVRNHIAINKDAAGNYINFTKTDSTIANNNTKLFNSGAYLQWQQKINNALQVTTNVRYDYFSFNYSGLTKANFSFNAFSPSVGLTYNKNWYGLYANTGKGFTPPQTNDLFGQATPTNLKPANFINYEFGGWAKTNNNNFSGELNVYRLNGINEIVYSLSNNILRTINAGKTSHTGLEYTLQYQPQQSWQIKLAGTIAEHKYINYEDEGKFFNGKQMPWASKHQFLLSLTKQFTINQWHKLIAIVDFNRIGAYYLDDNNTLTYPGHNLVNCRINYSLRNRYQFFLHGLNVLNKHHAVLAYKGKYGFGYNLGEPVTISFGTVINL
jgi:iron complex outermembrane recepter protein